MINNHLTRLCLVAVCLVSVALRVSANDTLNDVIPNANLSDILRQAKWDGIIGTWVDAESMGTDVKTTYAWKIKDKVIEITTIRGKHQDVALMAINGKTGAVFHMGADSESGLSMGKWVVQDNGDAVLGLVYTTNIGQEGNVIIRHRLIDKNTMMVTTQAPKQMRFKMIRTKPEDEADKKP